MRVAVVGGGISGLAAAEAVVRSHPSVAVTVLEAAGRLGGVIRTEHSEGYVIEHGPDALLAAKPAAAELCARVGLAGRLHGTTTGIGRAYVLREGRLRRLPSGMSGLVPARPAALLLARGLSWPARLRAALEPLMPRGHPLREESVEHFVVRRLGRGMYEDVVEPLLSGIHAGDGGTLSLDAAFPQLRALEQRYGSLARGARRVRPGGSGFVSLRGGLGELVHALSGALEATGRVSLRTGAEVRKVHASDSGARLELASGDRVDADAVVVATAAAPMGRLVAGLSAAAAALLAQVRSSSVSIVTLGFPATAVRRPLDASGYVVPRRDGRPVLACTWSSVKFPGRAPAGRALFRVFIGGAGRADAAGGDDASLIGIARAELGSTLGATGIPELVRVARWRDAMPQYAVGHAHRMSRVRAELAGLPWLALAGNMWDGVGISDCIRSGERAAAEVLAHLVTRGAPVPA
ncbi:MAG TPA: protoporphyrinogen oxidase [Gemmatimonadales bacterium]|nr:protoporphyrinogen oxidase [Gemmatimonadales bacterium]